MQLSTISGHFSKAARLLGFVVFGLLLAAPVSAQQAAAPTAPLATAPTAQQSPAPTDPKSNLKSSLNDLSTLYQNEVQRLEKRHEQSKALYADGIISRLEFENGEKELAAARAKVESVAKEIALANQPAPALIATPDAGFGAPSNLVWTTGSSRVDGLIRQYGTQYGVDPYLIYCLMSQESSFISNAVSPKGAQIGRV